MEEEQAKKVVECRIEDRETFECVICLDDCCTLDEMYIVCILSVTLFLFFFF